jgi:glucosamine--fructose-6-phosphate aminotransferase (isomerizing)
MISAAVEVADRGEFEHFMLKEIYEQPRALAATLGAVADGPLIDEQFGAEAAALFDQVETVQIVACGTSFHAGLVARYWLEDIAGIPCDVEVASEFRYRKRKQHANTLLVTVTRYGVTIWRNRRYTGGAAQCNRAAVPG